MLLPVAGRRRRRGGGAAEAEEEGGFELIPGFVRRGGRDGGGPASGAQCLLC